MKPQLSLLMGGNRGPDPTVKIMEQIELVFQEDKDIEKDILKEVLESIVQELKAGADRVLKVDTKLVSKFMVFEK
jgi:hypothetical protein